MDLLKSVLLLYNGIVLYTYYYKWKRANDTKISHHVCRTTLWKVYHHSITEINQFRQLSHLRKKCPAVSAPKWPATSCHLIYFKTCDWNSWKTSKNIRLGLCARKFVFHNFDPPPPPNSFFVFENSVPIIMWLYIEQISL